MSEELVGLVNAVARVGASFLVQSTILVSVALVAVLLLRTGLSLDCVPFPEAHLVAAAGDEPSVDTATPTPVGGSSRALSPSGSSSHPQSGAALAHGVPRPVARRPSASAYACAGLALLWAAGSAILLGHLAFCHRHLAQVRRRARPVSNPALVAEM